MGPLDAPGGWWGWFPPPTTCRRTSSSSYSSSLRRFCLNRLFRCSSYTSSYFSAWQRRLRCLLLRIVCSSFWYQCATAVEEEEPRSTHPPSPQIWRPCVGGQTFGGYSAYLIFLKCPADTLFWFNFRPEPPPPTPLLSLSYLLFSRLYLLFLSFFARQISYLLQNPDPIQHRRRSPLR